MRKDIEININTGDIILMPRPYSPPCPFKLVDYPEGLSRYAYAEVEIPQSMSNSNLLVDGVCVSIPYMPLYKEFMIRFRRKLSDELSEWRVVTGGAYGGDVRNLYLSELFAISESDFLLRIEGDTVRLYSAGNLDFNIIQCDRQNANMLLACAPTNNYRYPVSGVGLIRWVNGTVNDGTLTDTLIKEFSEDGMTINNASFDSDSKQLKIDAISHNS